MVLCFCRCHPPIVVIVILLNRLFRSDSVVPVFNSKTLFTDHNPVTASSTVLKIKAKLHGLFYCLKDFDIKIISCFSLFHVGISISRCIPAKRIKVIGFRRLMVHYPKFNYSKSVCHLLMLDIVISNTKIQFN